jgi:hypothetical protein
MNYDLQVLFVSDSRGRDFLKSPLPHSDLFKTEYIIIGGASIRTLERETITKVKSISLSNPNTVFIVKIAAGICEVTKKEQHAGGVELVLREQTYVLTNLLNFKERLHCLGRKILVSFATIPPISFEQALQHNISKNKLWAPTSTKEHRLAQQDAIFHRLSQINHALIQENTKLQEIGNLGSCRPAQLLWHQQIVRETKRRRSSKVVLRIPLTALVDGVHAGPEVFSKWSTTLYHSLQQDAERIVSLMN